MEVEAPEFRLRVCIGHDDDGRAVAAPDVGDLRAAAQLLVDAVEGRYPLRRQARPVSGSEEPFGAAEQAGVVVTPAHRTVTLVRVLDLVDVHEEGCERLHAPRDGYRRSI